MSTFIEKLFEFNLWANTEIIKLCASLDEAQLVVEIPEITIELALLDLPLSAQYR